MNVGVGFLVLAMLLTPAVDGVAKTLSADHTPMMIAFVRYLSAGLIALAVARGTGRAHRRRRSGDRVGQLVRTALIMGAMTALIAALGMVPMAKAVGGFLIAPIVSGLLGILVWREPPTATRLAGSAVSFMGAAVLLRPEAGLEPGCVFALIGGALLGTYLAATRGAKSQTDALSTLAVQSLLGAGADRALRARRRPAGADAGAPRRRAGARRHLGGLPLPDRRRLPARRGDAARAVPLLQPADRDGRRLPLVRRDAERSPASSASLAIAAGGLVTLMNPERLALPPAAAGRPAAALRVTGPAFRA